MDPRIVFYRQVQVVARILLAWKRLVKELTVELSGGDHRDAEHVGIPAVPFFDFFTEDGKQVGESTVVLIPACLEIKSVVTEYPVAAVGFDLDVDQSRACAIIIGVKIDLESPVVGFLTEKDPAVHALLAHASPETEHGARIGFHAVL